MRDGGGRMREEVPLMSQLVVDAESLNGAHVGGWTPERSTVMPALEAVYGVGKDQAPVASRVVDAGHPEDEHGHLGELDQLRQESVGRSEEQRPLEAVGDDVFIEQARLSASCSSGRAAGRRAARTPPGGPRARSTRATHECRGRRR